MTSSTPVAPAAAETLDSVSVVICAYTEERWDDLLAAVRSVQQQRPRPAEIVVVIDHNDVLLQRAHQALPECLVLANAEERGLSGARNTGIAATHGGIVVFLDDDATAEPGWLATLVDPFLDPRVLGVGGAAWPLWTSGQPAWFPTEFNWVVGCSYTGLPEQRAAIRNLMGCNMAFRREVFQAVGGFRHGIGRVGKRPVGCEETELCIRATQHFPDGIFLFDPDAVVRHRVPAARARFAYFKARCYAEGLSKALVSRFVGTADGLSSERAYVTRTLPVGVLRRLRPSSGAGRIRQATAIAAGVLWTAAGYVVGRAQSRTASHELANGNPLNSTEPAVSAPQPHARRDDQSAPTWVGEVELSGGLPDEIVAGDHGYVQARVLVRLHRRPVGFVNLPVVDGRVDGETLRSRVWEQLKTQIQAHLASDGVALPEELPMGGVGGGQTCSSDARLTTQDLISVVVCTRDRPDSLRNCLNALQRLHYPNFEVVVVDNAPATDQTEEVFAREFSADGRFRYVREPVAGLSRARNRGLSEARGRVIAFTDDDVRVDPWWLDGIVEGFARQAGTGCVTGLVPAAELENAAQVYFDQRVSWSSSCEPRVYDLDRNRPDSPLYPYAAGQFGTGANFAFDREFLTALGGFDEALGAGSPAHGGEDLDIFVRALRSGRPLVYEPAAIVWHIHRADESQLRTQMFNYGLGLTAFMTKYLIDLRTARDLLRRAPQGVLHAREMLSGTGDAPGQAAPASRRLVAAELLGMAKGPLAYYRGRRLLRGRPALI